MPDEMTTNPNPVADRLPELNEEDEEGARTEKLIGWAFSFMGNYTPGDLHYYSRGYIVLQKVDINTVRCIQVHDEEECLKVLALFRTTFEAAGIEFQIDPYTLVTPIPADVLEARERARTDGEARLPEPAVTEMSEAVSARIGTDDVGMEVV